MTTVRQATVEDVPFFGEVLHSVHFQEHPGSPPEPVAEWKANATASHLEHVLGNAPGSTLYVIEVGAKPAGRLRVVRTPERLHLAGIQILPAYQGQGVGTAVISGLLREARDRKVPAVLQVSTHNPSAERLYARLGFWLTGEVEGDDRWMSTGEVLQDREYRPVVRIGDTVRHPTQDWTPAIHALLDYLNEAGFAYAPRVIDVEGDTEVLSYIDGESGPDGWAKVVDDDGLRAAARLLREYHDVVARWLPTQSPTWFTGQVGTGGEGEVVCHGDFGPWNIVWHGTQPVGLLDWEYAHLASPLEDVAYALEYMAPFRDDAECVRWLRYPEPPHRRHRIEVFAEAYGLSSTEGLVDLVIETQRKGLEAVRSLATQGYERQVKAVADGDLERIQRQIDWSEQHRHLFE